MPVHDSRRGQGLWSLVVRTASEDSSLWPPPFSRFFWCRDATNRRSRFGAPMHRYSALALLKHAVTGRPWPRVWRDPAPRDRYDVVVVGGGGHGSGDRLLPRQGIQDPECRGAGEGLYRLRQCRAQHHHRALQLHAARRDRVLRLLAAALEQPVARAELQRHVQSARADPAAAFARWAGFSGAARQHHAPARHRRTPAGPRGDAGTGAASGLPAERPLPDLGRLDAAHRRHGAPRRRGVGLRAGGFRSWRRYHPELRGHRLRAPGRPSRGRRDDTRPHHDGKGRPRRGGSHVAPGRNGRAAPADREPSVAGLRVRAGEAAAELCHWLRRARSLLYQPIG